MNATSTTAHHIPATRSTSDAAVGRSDSAAPLTTALSSAPISRTAMWSGRIVSGVVSLLLTMDAGLKVLMLGPAVEGTAQLGYPAHIVFPLGLIQAVSLILYLIPRTSVLRAVLWTGYLGGAVATHVRLDNPLFTHTLSPIYVAIMLWGGLWLRDRRLRNVFAKPQ